jgi:hypothetical protein
MPLLRAIKGSIPYKISVMLSAAIGWKSLTGTRTSFFVRLSAMKEKVLQLYLVWRQDTQHDDTWLKDIQHNHTLHNGTA